MGVPSTEDRVAGALLWSARTSLGLSQTAFAGLLGIAQLTLSAYESGRRQPTLPTLLRLLGRAGLELRMEMSPQDRHDEVLAE
jgi:transcriptional regulator with XRE-family HTH domain